MSNEEWRPRITVDVDESLYFEVQRVIPRGMRKALVEIMLQDIVQILGTKDHSDRMKILALIIDRQVGITELMPSMKEKANG